MVVLSDAVASELLEALGCARDVLSVDRTKHGLVEQELGEWRELAISTDFAG